MAKKISSAVIGGFVISSIGLLIGGVLLFGSGNFFKQTEKYILYFDEVVTGLNVGSPVKFRGVEIGSVKSIVLLADTESLEVDIPIVIEIDRDRFKVQNESRVELAEKLDTLIDMGLRAQLDVESLITSQLFIQIDFWPDKPAKLSGTARDYPEIPTIKSNWSQITEILKDIPLTQTFANVREITDKINLLLESGKVNDILEHLDESIISAGKLTANADTMVANLDREIAAVSTEIREAIPALVNIVDQTAAELDEATRQAGVLISHVDSEVSLISEDLQGTLASAENSLEQASATLAAMGRFVETSDTRTKLNNALDRIANAARSLSKLTDYLERHPEALLKGKKN